MPSRYSRALVWFRRDLRTADHAALHFACHQARQVWCAFIFDSDILDPLPRQDRRVEFIRESLVDLDGQLRSLGLSLGVPGIGLIVRCGIAAEEIARLAATLQVQAVFSNHDDDPMALARDSVAQVRLENMGVAWKSFKDHVVFEGSELLTLAGKPYTVFTPYRNAWMRKLDASHLPDHDLAPHAAALAPCPLDTPAGIPELAQIGFRQTNLSQLRLPVGSQGAQLLLEDFLLRIDRYADQRDFPSLKGPSYLSTHLRFGTLSIRHLVREAWQRMQAGSRGAEVWLNELIWRDFYHQLLCHHPHVVVGAFRPAYDAIAWDQGAAAEVLLQAWCEGRTGFPLVDAAMHQLNQTGYMHNRLRMVVASFLTKDLGLDWRRGEAYFARQLLDFDLASNNGGWQWAASTGCDAQPWFRVFNPVIQSRKFDPEGRFIRRYLPQLSRLSNRSIHAPWLAGAAELGQAGMSLGRDYPAPVVDHESARQRTLLRFQAIRDQRGV